MDGTDFLLSGSPYDYSLSQIGLVGLVGLAGALVARKAGVLHDRGHAYQGLIIGLGLAIFALLSTFFVQTLSTFYWWLFWFSM